MQATEYQQFTRTTAMYGDKLKTRQERIMYCMFGLIGEVGEIAEKFKNI